MAEILNSEALRRIAILVLGIFLAGLIIRVLVLFRREMAGSEKNPRPGVWIEANWGGLGGGLSGWRVSNAMVYLLLISLLLGCLCLAIVSLAPPKKPPGSQDDQTSGKKDDSKKDADKKDDKKEDQKGELKQPDQKLDQAKPADSPTGDKNLKKSIGAPTATKKAEK
jgi:hypothetical protein